MASTSSSSSASRPDHTPAAVRYDVFLSFRGEDTRHNFTDHLYHALLRAGVSTFRDDDEIERGQQLKPELETAIIESRASIVVLSENYANSRWCLDELCLILKQRLECNRFVLPVFYHVDPSDVRNQRGSFAIQSSKGTDDDVRRWKGALTEVANLTGLVVSGSETNFISEVVAMVQSKLDLKLLSVPADLTGMETRAEVINLWFKIDQSSAIAICGMGGSGKTTLSEHIYNLHKQDFESSSFVEEVGKRYKENPLKLQKQLLRDLVGGKKKIISSVSEGTYKIEEILQKKKVLIVLDDIDDEDELTTLLGTKALPRHSKIIITTRRFDIHEWFGSKKWSCWLYNLALLNNVESLELFSWHAFRSKTPMEDFRDLAVQLAQYCEGNPLALKVLGSSLVVTNENPNMIKNMMGIWRSRLNSLNSLKGNIDFKIQAVLKKSFDSLPLSSQRELLLHIACFFIDEYVHIVQTILEDELFASSGISDLYNRCLITFTATGRVRMHQLLQEMVRNVICEESKFPGKRSRIWDDTESYHVLRKGNGSDTVEGLSLDMRKVKQGTESEVLALKTSSLVNMDNLKLLRLKYVKLSGTYENFPELRWLCWYGCRLQTMPLELLMSSLVILDMSFGSMEKFEVPWVLNSLKRLELKCCFKLVSICNLFRLPNLEALVLSDCRSLTHLCKSIRDLESLTGLDLAGCSTLLKSHHEQHLLTLPQSLSYLELANCDLEHKSEVCLASSNTSYDFLSLAANPFEYLPHKIDLRMVRDVNLAYCSKLKSLLCIPCTLVDLHVDWCTSLERITFESGRFTLKTFSYKGCFKLSEVQGFFKLVPIAKIDKVDLVQHMQWIKEYEDLKVDLVGDEIATGRIWHTQMLYEYGIMSTYLQGITDQSLPIYEYEASSDRVAFIVPSHHEKKMIKGLIVSCLYKSLGPIDEDNCSFFARISNITQGLTWVYNPVVYCKPRVDEDVMWLSYWPIGSNFINPGDMLSVTILIYGKLMPVIKCGASLVYADSGVGEDEKCDNNTMIDEEVIGGNLSEFKVATGCFYLSRRDFFYPLTSIVIKGLFNADDCYAEPGWKKALLSKQVKHIRDVSSSACKTIELGVSPNSEIELGKIEKAISSIEGVESVSVDKEIGKLTVTGYVDPIEVANYVRRAFDNVVVDILSLLNTFIEETDE